MEVYFIMIRIEKTHQEVIKNSNLVTTTSKKHRQIDVKIKQAITAYETILDKNSYLRSCLE